MTKLRWRYGLIAGIFLAIFASYPQLNMWHSQGEQWNGHYAYNDIDEVAYAAYLKALIDGRPRKNDPYTGRDDSTGNPQPESLFSIQFAAPYTIAIPARIFGVSASTAMTVTGALAGFFAALACFWLIGLLTGDSMFAMAASLIVLCGGALAAGEGAIGEILGVGVSYPYFPFLRRYLPAVPFPVFFVLLVSVWQLLRSEPLQRRVVFGFIAFTSFTFLVFSYFYIWTTAAAWLACLTLLCIGLRPAGWERYLRSLIVLGLSCIVPLAIYAYLLAQRSPAMDKVQLLVYTREVDLFRFPEYISFAVLFAMAAGVVFKLIELRTPATIFVISFALVPIIVFNQQVVTGHSLQPIHYQVFIGNYVAALALVGFIGLFWRKLIENKPLLGNSLAIIFALSAVIWGFVECHYTVRVLDGANTLRDQGMPLAKKLRGFENENPNPFRNTILSIGNIYGDDSPTIAPQNVLWSRHQHIFAGLSWQESKERYYQYLYYQNLDEKWLEKRLRNGDFVSMISLFGWARHSKRLSFDSTPLTFGEISEEARLFKNFRDQFGFEQASNPKLSYLVVPKDWKIDLTNVDKWYERDEGEIIGIYRLYILKLKSEKRE